jgi:hypothetical protein
VPDLRAFLARFRPSAPPGPAAEAGVPADRVPELAAELAPVLALLVDTERAAEQIRAAATVAAAERLRAAHAQAETIGPCSRAGRTASIWRARGDRARSSWAG